MVDQPDPKKRLPGESFADWRARLNAAKNPKPETTTWDPNQWDPDLVPQVRDNSERSEDDLELDRALDSINILDAYRVWCGKMTPDVGGKSEGIMISCPNPDHKDSNPSAWINTDKQTYYCGSCDEGGDKYDIAAMNLGYEGYKNDGAKFMELRKRMAQDFGWTIKKTPGGQIIVPPTSEDEDETESDPQPEPEPSNVQTLHVLPEPGEDDSDEDEMVYPRLRWREIVPKDTFLWEYMIECTKDDAPEEYHFWHGLMLLGHAGGNKVWLEDSPQVYGNMLLCILGKTGQGKSRSRRWMKQIMDEVLPFNESMTPPTGVHKVATPRSGEFLIDQFKIEQADPTTGIKTLQPVNGFVEVDEMSRFVSTYKSQNSTLKEVVMQMGDHDTRVHTGSLSTGIKVALNPFCSVATSTQPRTIRTMFSDTDQSSGFLNRWLFVAGPPKPRQAMGGKWAEFRVDLAAPIERLKHIKSWASLEKEVDFDSEETYLLWKEYFRTVIEPILDSQDSDLLQRLDLHHKRLLLLFAINLRTTKITEDILRRVMTLTDYLLKCYAMVNENIGVTRNREIADEILRQARHIEKKQGRPMTMKQLNDNIKRKNWDDRQIRDTIKVLIELDKLEELKPAPGKPGRPTLRYRAVGE